MATRAKKLNLYLRFDTKGWHGLGHASRCLELAKKLRKEFNIILCTNINKQFISENKNKKFFLKKKMKKKIITS